MIFFISIGSFGDKEFLFWSEYWNWKLFFKMKKVINILFQCNRIVSLSLWKGRERILFPEIDFWIHKKAVVSLGKDREYALFFLRMTLDCLESVFIHVPFLVVYSWRYYLLV